MFYIKTRKRNGKTTRTEITDENVFTRCPECGRELSVDFAEVFGDGEGDLFSTAIICSACTKKRLPKRGYSEGGKITIEGLMLLTGALFEAGYNEQLNEVYDRFGIDEVAELTHDQYAPFAAAIVETVAVD